MIFLPNRWAIQPQAPVGLNRSNPLTRGLKIALVPANGRGVRDLITGGAFTTPGLKANRGYLGWDVATTTTDTVEGATTVAFPATIAAVFIPGTLAAGANVFSFVNSGAINTRSRLGLRIDSTATKIDAYSMNATGTAVQDTSTNTIVAGQVNVAVAQLISTSSRKVWLNGIAGAGNSTSNIPASIDTISAGSAAATTTRQTGLAGQYLLLLAWDHTLTDQEIREFCSNPWQILWQPAVTDAIANLSTAGNADGATGTVTTGGVAGTATGAAAASGAVGTATVGGTAGAATGAAAASGATGTATSSGVPGGAVGVAAASGATGTATSSGVPGAATGAASASGATGTATSSSGVPGGAMGAATVSGATGTATAGGIPGDASAGSTSGSADGALGTVTVGGVPGTATGESASLGGGGPDREFEEHSRRAIERAKRFAEPDAVKKVTKEDRKPPEPPQAAEPAPSTPGPTPAPIAPPTPASQAADVLLDDTFIGPILPAPEVEAPASLAGVIAEQRAKQQALQDGQEEEEEWLMLELIQMLDELD